MAAGALSTFTLIVFVAVTSSFVTVAVSVTHWSFVPLVTTPAAFPSVSVSVTTSALLLFHVIVAPYNSSGSVILPRTAVASGITRESNIFCISADGPTLSLI